MPSEDSEKAQRDPRTSYREVRARIEEAVRARMRESDRAFTDAIRRLATRRRASD